MKSIVLACVLMISVFQKMAIGQGSEFAKLPEPFDGIETNCFIKNSVVPIGIYLVTEYKNGCKAFFVCVGTMYWEGEDVAKAIVPKHMFRDASKYDESYGYGVRIARPDSHSIVGFVTGVEDLSGEKFGRDVALVSIGTNKVSARKLASGIVVPAENFHENMIRSNTNSVMVRDKVIKSLRSLITNKEVKILGYVLNVDESFFKSRPAGSELFYPGPVTDLDKTPSIAIDVASDYGFSGSAFFDEHGRMFIVTSSLLRPDWGATKGVTVLTGPVTLKRSN
jgi:hypothetical protein